MKFLKPEWIKSVSEHIGQTKLTDETRDSRNGCDLYELLWLDRLPDLHKGHFTRLTFDIRLLYAHLILQNMYSHIQEIEFLLI